jgi:hypothetical protein
MRGRAIVLATAVAGVVTVLAATPSRAAPPPAPGAIHSLRSTTRAIVVTSGSWRTTHAVMRADQRVGRHSCPLIWQRNQDLATSAARRRRDRVAGQRLLFVGLAA